MSASDPLRLMIYDRTCAGRRFLPGLSHAWQTGAMMYRALGRLDATFGATSWDEALSWAVALEPSRSIGEIQYWGHGKWGTVFVDRDPLDAAAFAETHALRPKLEAVRERLAPGALVWLRTCEAFGATRGHDFAMRFADFMGTPVAGHTYVIDAIQSGLRGLRPGQKPDWSATEGIREGTADEPKRAYGSSLLAPRTITCFDGRIPDGWL